jgi:preprotein translocase subunit SecF
MFQEFILLLIKQECIEENVGIPTTGKQNVPVEFEDLALQLYQLKVQDLAQEQVEQVTVVTVEDTEEVMVELDIDQADQHIEVVEQVIQVAEVANLENSGVLAEVVSEVVVEEDSAAEAVAQEEVGQGQTEVEVILERDIKIIS